MGYADPSYVLDRIRQLASEMSRSLEKQYPAGPEDFLENFVSELSVEATRLEVLAGRLRSVARATAISRYGVPEVSGEYGVLGWVPVDGVPVWRVHRRDSWQTYGFDDYDPAPAEAEVVIYLDQYTEASLQQVEEAALLLADDLGYTDFSLIEEESGSIWRRFKGKLQDGVSSDFVKERMLELDSRVSIELIGKAQAENDAIKTSSAVSLIESLAEIPNAVVRVGGALIIKYTDPVIGPCVLSRDLTTREIRAMERNPGIQRDPRHVLELLAVAVQELPDDPEDEPPSFEHAR